MVLWIVFAVAVAACAGLVALTPYEQMLGNLLKPVLFHGASVWVNLGTFTLAGVLAVVYLVTRRPGCIRVRRPPRGTFRSASGS